MTNNDQKIPDINSKPIDPNNEEIKNQYQDILNEYSKHIDEVPQQSPSATETLPTPPETDPIIPPVEPVTELPPPPEPSIQTPPQPTPIETEIPPPIESIPPESEIPQTIEPASPESQIPPEEPLSPLPPRPPQEPSIQSPLPERESFNVPSSSDDSLPPQPPVITDNQSLPSSGIFKILFFISLFIFLSISGTIAYTLLKDKSTPVNNAVPSSIPETSEIAAPIPTVITNEESSIETADNSSSSSTDLTSWQTYTNSTYKYSLKYPNTWTLKTDINSKKDISLETPEYQEVPKEIMGGLPSLCGLYYFRCYKNINEYEQVTINNANTKSTLLSEYLNTQKDTHKIINKKTYNNQTLYEVEVRGMDLTNSYFIEKPDNSFCEITFCGQKSDNDKFIDTFKFN